MTAPKDVKSLSEEEVEPRLRTRWLGRPYTFLEETSSTNSWLAAQATRGAPHGAVVVADAQRAGRGRHGRPWQSPAGMNLYLSLLLRPSWPAGEMMPISLAAGLAVAETVATYLPRRPTIKWPNDVLVARRKLAGVLVEVVSEASAIRHAIVGIGVNVNQLDFTAELAGHATSLRQETGGPVARAEVLARMLFSLERCLVALDQNNKADLLAQVRSYVDWMGDTIAVNTPQGRVHGVAEDLDARGVLHLRDSAGVLHEIVAGDLELGRQQAPP